MQETKTTTNGMLVAKNDIEVQTKISNPSVFLSNLYDQNMGFIEIRAISRSDSPKDHKVRSLYYKSVEDISFNQLRELNQKAYNLYFGVGTRKEKKGNKSSVLQIPALWVDIDVSGSTNKRKVLFETYKKIHESKLIPTFIVDSGNGFHLYFKLKDIYEIRTTSDVERIEGILRGLARIFSGDNVCDISRVMRLPSFYNLKDPAKPRKSRVLNFADTVHELTEFDSIKVEKKSSTKKEIDLGQIPDQIPEKFNSLLKSEPKLKATWGGHREDLDDQSGSGYDMSLSSILVKHGFSDVEIARILLDAPYEKKNKRTENYLSSTISKVRSECEASATFTTNINNPISKLSDISLKREDLENVQVESLIEGFLPKESIMLLTSKHGVGKSILGYAIAKKMIEDGYLVVIVDADNSMPVIADRLRQAGLSEYLGSELDSEYIESKLSYIHSSRHTFKFNTNDENWENFKQKLKDGNVLVIFDNLKVLCPIGTDFDRDLAMSPIMGELMCLRDMHNTIILLHHVSKDGGDSNPSKNSGSITDSADVGYLLKRNGDRFELKSFKDRIPVDKEVIFELGSDFSLNSKLSKDGQKKIEDMKTVYEGLVSLSAIKSDIKQQDIFDQFANARGISKDRIRKALKDGENILWDIKSGERKTLLYSLNPEAQKSKNLDSYIRNNIGFLENTLDNSDNSIEEWTEEEKKEFMDPKNDNLIVIPSRFLP